jgi:hypothetical protein
MPESLTLVRVMALIAFLISCDDSGLEEKASSPTTSVPSCQAAGRGELPAGGQEAGRAGVDRQFFKWLAAEEEIPDPWPG